MRRILFALLLLAMSLHAQAQQYAPDGSRLPKQLQGIGIDQRLNAQVPLDVPFRDQDGAAVTLRDYMAHGPVLLVPVYYTCPMLCSQILHGMVAGLRPLKLAPGKDYQIVAFSFNPSETSADALRERNNYMQLYSSQADPRGWHFLTGSPQSIATLTEAIGFHYRFDPQTQMFIHASGLMILTPEGRISHYFYGVEYEPKDLDLGLVEASHRTIGSPVEAILLFCCRYDPVTGKYGADVVNLLKICAGAMLAFLGIGLGMLWRRDLQRSREAATTAGHP